MEPCLAVDGREAILEDACLRAMTDGLFANLLVAATIGAALVWERFS